MNAIADAYPDHDEYFLKEMQKMAEEDMDSALERDLQEKRVSDAGSDFEDITRPLDLNEDEIFIKIIIKPVRTR